MRINATKAVGGRATRHAVLLALFTLTLASLAVLFSSGTASAASGFIREMPRDRPLGIFVMGDSFGSELADGLKWAFRGKRNITVRKRTKPATGLVRTDQYDWLKSVRRLLSKEQVDVAVIAIGGNDRQDMRVKGKRYERFTIGWRMEYMKRLQRLAGVLKKSGAAVYWVGLPIVRSKRMTKDYARFNRYYSGVSKDHSFRYIGIRGLFRSKSGGYAAYGKGLDGKTVRLRDKDGIHLTIVGAKKLGRFIARQIRKDLPGDAG